MTLEEALEILREIGREDPLELYIHDETARDIADLLERQNYDLTSLKSRLVELEQENAELRKALEVVEKEFVDIFECVPMRDCLHTECNMANGGNFICRNLAKAVIGALRKGSAGS